MKPHFKAIQTAIAFLLVAGCAREPQHTASPAALSPLPVKTIEVTNEQVVRFEEVAGTVQPKTRAVIEAKTSGRIVNMPARLGSEVQKGDLLVQLDAAEFQAKLDQATATRIQAETDLKRARSLLDQQAMTRAEFDAAQARFTVADAALREAETFLSYIRVRAPFAGAVVRKLADEGNLAAPGKPLLELEDRTQMRFVAEVPEALIGRIHSGVELSIQIPSLNRNVQGKVVEIAPGADPVSRTSRVELELAGDSLRSGAFGRLLIPARPAAGLFVPLEAVVARGQLDLLFVVRTNRAELRLVRTGRQIEDRIEILAGVQPGEQVVLSDPGMLRDGQPVSVQ
jgi:RND family efflux transporter MFP subunit